MTQLATCRGFAYSAAMGCLEAMRVRAVASLVFGVHALCQEVTAVTAVTPGSTTDANADGGGNTWFKGAGCLEFLSFC